MRGPVTASSAVLGCVFLEEGYSIFDSQDTLGGVIRNFDAKLFFKGHNKLDRVETVSAKIIDKASSVDNFVTVNAKMFYDDSPYTI
tara:strand:- start:396 stop:653 length:258 start_codon:yes stop_codon:yes gene_type:complete